MKRRCGQGAFEYILILGGILLVVLISVLVLRGSVSSAGQNVNQSFSTAAQTQNLALGVQRAAKNSAAFQRP